MGSSAGTVTISITIIDISKASKSKVIGATGRIVQDLNSAMDKEKKHTENNEGCSFDMEGFLNQKKTTEILVEENSSEDDSEILSECPTITPTVDDKYELSDSEESVSAHPILSYHFVSPLLEASHQHRPLHFLISYSPLDLMV